MLLQCESSKYTILSVGEMKKSPINFTQVSMLVNDILKNVEFDAIRIIFNRFQSIVSSTPTVSTVLSSKVIEKRV